MGARTVEIVLDRPRRLKFDWNALADFEKAGGKFEDVSSGGFHTLRLLLWAGLKWNDRTMTPERAGDLVQEFAESDENDLSTLGDVLRDALNASGIVSLDDESGEAKTPEAGGSSQ